MPPLGLNLIIESLIRWQLYGKVYFLASWRYFHSMEISQDVREYAAEKGIKENKVLKQGVDEKSGRFLKEGTDIYHKV